MKEEGNKETNLPFSRKKSYLLFFSKFQDIAMAKAIYAENKDSPAPLRKRVTSGEERAKTFR